MLGMGRCFCDQVRFTDDGCLDIRAHGRPAMGSRYWISTTLLGNNHGLLDGNKRIAFTAADIFLRRNGFYIELEGLNGPAFMVGSIERHEFRFAQILDCIRRNTKPLV